MISTGTYSECNTDISCSLAVIAESTRSTEREHNITVCVVEATQSDSLFSIISTSRCANLESGSCAIIIDRMETSEGSR